MDYGRYLHWLIEQPPGSVSWYGTKRDLVELIAIVAEEKVIKDYRGFPLSQRKLAQYAFRAVGLSAPTRLSCVVWQIRNRINVFPPLERRVKNLRNFPSVAQNDDKKSTS